MANPLYGQNKADDKIDKLKSGKILGVKTVNASETLVAADAGKLIMIGTAAIEVTLPTAAEGLFYDFCLKVESTAGTTIVASSGDCVFGTVHVESTTADNTAVHQVVPHATAIGTVTSYDNVDFVHDSATLGGHAGDVIRLTAVDDTAWLLQGTLTTDHANPGTIAVINAG
tara:strand:- start:149 stop:661 length:513 start_codon:yes stop_codon:yes gene_type:complete